MGEALLEPTLVQWRELREYGLKLVEGLSEQEMVVQPVAGRVMNHASWVLSHLGVYGSVMSDIFRGRTAADPLKHRYGRESKPEPSAGAYETRADMVRWFAEGYDDAAAALWLLAERDELTRVLGEATPIERWRARFPTKAYLPGQFLVKHVATHLGQLSAWRRACGLGAV